MRSELARDFFNELKPKTGFNNLVAVVVTHVLPDRLIFLPALEAILPIHEILAIPYSLDRETAAKLSNRYRISEPTLEELRTPGYMVRPILSAPSDKSVVVVDIGGYYAFLQHEEFEVAARLRGVVEDTEAGHRSYERVSKFRHPVFSVARSPLKLPEDLIVGMGVSFSLDRVLREQGSLPGGACCLVLGFGRVGRGVASAFRAANYRVLVYDSDPVKRLEALALGFHCPDRSEGLVQADVVIGATGSRSIEFSDLDALKSGVWLVSASSKDVEFPISEIKSAWELRESQGALQTFGKGQRSLVVAYEGRPLNFRDKAVIDHYLWLSMAEILQSIILLAGDSVLPALHEVSEAERLRIASTWLNRFVVPATGALIR